MYKTEQQIRTNSSKSLQSLNRLDSFLGSIYSFSYTPRNKPRRSPKSGRYMKGRGYRAATDGMPLILALVKKGKLVYKAKNGNTLMMGINLNYLAPGTRQYVIERFGHSVGVDFTTASKLDSTLGLSYRMYDTTYMNDLSIVDPTKYIAGLQHLAD